MTDIAVELHQSRFVIALTLFTDYLYCVERYLTSHNLLIIGGIGTRVKRVHQFFFIEFGANTLTIES